MMKIRSTTRHRGGCRERDALHRRHGGRGGPHCCDRLPRFSRLVYAQCESLGRAYINGDDIHEKTGRLIGAYDHLDPVEARQIGKTSNFLLGYLGGALRLQATIFKDTGMVVSLEFCEEVHRNYHLGGDFWKVTIDGAPSWLRATEDEVAEYERRRSIEVQQTDNCSYSKSSNKQES